MENIKKVSWKPSDDELNKEVLRRHRDEDIRDDDAITSDRVADSKLPVNDADDDDANLEDDDRYGRDLDTDNTDEWDEADFETDEDESELDDTDLDDDDEANADVHSVKNDKFGSLASGINKSSGPDPDEIPEERGVGNKEVEAPNQGGVEHGRDNEADYPHKKEVTQPNTEPEPHKRDATLADLDETNIGIEHTRTTERMVDHEPGTAGDHLAPNL